MANIFIACNVQYIRDSQQNSYLKFYVRKLENNIVSFSVNTKKLFLKLNFLHASTDWNCP